MTTTLGLNSYYDNNVGLYSYEFILWHARSIYLHIAYEISPSHCNRMQRFLSLYPSSAVPLSRTSRPPLNAPTVAEFEYGTLKVRGVEWEEGGGEG